MALFAPDAYAHSAESGDIAVGHIWAYPVQKSAKPEGGYDIDIYGPILNKGAEAEAVTSVTAPAKSTSIVKWIRGLQFEDSFPLALPPGQPVALNPDTKFLRLSGVDKFYGANDHFPITFHFEHTPPVTIDVMVQGK